MCSKLFKNLKKKTDKVAKFYAFNKFGCIQFVQKLYFIETILLFHMMQTSQMHTYFEMWKYRNEDQFYSPLPCRQGSVPCTYK